MGIERDEAGIERERGTGEEKGPHQLCAAFFVNYDAYIVLIFPPLVKAHENPRQFLLR